MKNDMNNTTETKVSSVSLKAGMIAGFIASIFSSIALFIMTSLAIVPEFNFMNSQAMLFGFSDTIFSAWVAYFFIGTVIWGLLYAPLERYLGTTNSPVGKGLVFGLLIWIIIMIVFMPLAGLGLFVKEFGAVAAVIVLVTDLIFGSILGTAYSSLKNDKK